MIARTIAPTANLSVLLLLGVATTAWSQTTHHVNGTCGNDAWTGTSPVCQAPHGPKRSIQAGINASVSGDTVIVADGTYTGPRNKLLDFAGNDIIVRSQNGPEHCTIDGERDGSAFVFDDREGTNAVVEGFTITRANGSAIRCDSASPTIRNCIIDDNWSGIFGGAVLCQNGANPTFDKCILSNNLAGVGGGLYCDSSRATLTRCAIFGNTTDLFGGAGVAAVNDSNITLINCAITENLARGFAGNGGGVQFNGSSGTLVNCLIAQNVATFIGGGIASVNDSDPTIINSTIAWNSAASNGGGIYVAGLPTIVNTILWSDAPEEIYIGTGDVDITFSDVQGGWPGLANIVADPRFNDPFAGDFRLQSDSPCIDAADNTAVPAGIVTDLDGNPRFVDDPNTPDTGVAGGAGGSAIVDMGAYEFQVGGCAGDLDGDGDTDLADLGILLADFGCTPPPNCVGDLDGDGDTDLADLGILLADFGCGP